MSGGDTLIANYPYLQQHLEDSGVSGANSCLYVSESLFYCLSSAVDTEREGSRYSPYNVAIMLVTL